jgi:SAM-dependent methyltransferase
VFFVARSIQRHNGSVPDEHRIREVAAHQRRYFNGVAAFFDMPQPEPVMDRLRHIVAAAGIHAGDVVLDVGSGAGVLLPLIRPYHPSRVLACDLAEEMLAHLRKNHPCVLAVQADVISLPLKPATVDVVFMNAMYGNIADKPAACRRAAETLRSGGRLVISHPEGKSFVHQLQATTDLFIEPFPAQDEFGAMVKSIGLQVIFFRDEPKLYVLVARKA